MKFVSKVSNLNIILRPGLQAQPLTGTPAVPTIFVKFRDGVAVVEDQKMVEMMVNHPGFNQDFIAADDFGTDPYAYLRDGNETKYVHEEIKFGHPISRSASPAIKTLPPEIKKMIQEQAMEIAKQMLPTMVQSTLKEIMAEGEKLKKEFSDDQEIIIEEGELSTDPTTGEPVILNFEKQKKRAGRPKKDV